MRILVTSASGANGNGYGAILGFSPEGEFTGPFSSDPRIADPRGMYLDPSGALVYLNSGDDRILALDLEGRVVRDSGRITGLDPRRRRVRARRPLLRHDAPPADDTCHVSCPGRGGSSAAAGGHRPFPARVRLRERRPALPRVRRRALR